MIKGKLFRAELFDRRSSPVLTVVDVYNANKDRYPDKIFKVMNANWSGAKGQAVGNYKVGGNVLSQEWASAIGFAWSGNEKPVMGWNDMSAYDNFIGTIPVLMNGVVLQSEMDKQTSGVKRLCERTWWGFDAQGECYAEVTTADYTLQQIVERMVGLGIVDGLALDGSGSSQWYDGKTYIKGDGRAIHSFLLLWFDEIDGEAEPPVVKKRMYLHGIDVSEHQGVIDWGKAENEIDFAMIRAGVGTRLDYQFIRNITECNRIGIPCGVYWFSYADNVTEAADEAARCLEAIKPYKVQYPVCFDFEYASATNIKVKGVTPTKALCSAICHAFCAATEAAGYYTMVYTNDGFISQYYDSTIAAKYDLWVPTYPTTVPTTFDNPPRSCGMWQYSDKGAITGIGGNVDLNVSYKDYASIITSAGLNNLTAEQASEETEPDNDTAEEQAAQKLIQAGYGDILIVLANKI